MAAASGRSCLGLRALGLSSWLLIRSSASYSTALRVTGGPSKDAVVHRGRPPQNARPKRQPGIPRTEKMEVDQVWSNVYPAAAAFKPSSVPLPIRMGYPVKRGIPPSKEGNLELLKIPNFLHLTPVAIRNHCAALKDFCTEWPAALDDDAKCVRHFPIEVDTMDYVSAGPSVRNPKARVVTLRVKLSSLNLDDHARKKLIKLVGERYCKVTDILTITTDRCPLKRQNYDYGLYLLTVLYHESWLPHEFLTTSSVVIVFDCNEKFMACCDTLDLVFLIGVILQKTEQWEDDKTEDDIDEYIWENSASQKNALDTLLRIRVAEQTEGGSREELLSSETVQDYRKSVVQLKSEGETEKNLSEYKNCVKRLLNINAL